MGGVQKRRTLIVSKSESFYDTSVDNGLARKRLVAQRSRCEGVYNRADEASGIMVRARNARSSAVTQWLAERSRDGAGERWF